MSIEQSPVKGTDPCIAKAQERLNEAATIVETMVFDLAGGLNRVQLSRLIQIAAELQQIQLKPLSQANMQSEG